MFDSSAFIYSVTAAALLLLVASALWKTAEWRTVNGAPPADDDDDDDLSGLRLGEVCVIPYGGGAMLGQVQIPSANPVYFVEDRADAVAAVKAIRRVESNALVDATENMWEIQYVRGVWWFARKYYYDSVSLHAFASMVPIPEVSGVQEAVDYLAGLRTSGDRRGRPQ